MSPSVAKMRINVPETGSEAAESYKKVQAQVAVQNVPAHLFLK